MKCKNTSKFMIDKLAGELSKRQEAKLEKHLNSCSECRKEFEELSKIWQVTNNTLNSDEFSLELSSDRRNEIFKIAEHEDQRHHTPVYMKRFLELTAVIVICLVLTVMLLPSSKSNREGAKNIYTEKHLKLAETKSKMSYKDAEETAPATPAAVLTMDNKLEIKPRAIDTQRISSPTQAAEPELNEKVFSYSKAKKLRKQEIRKEYVEERNSICRSKSSRVFLRSAPAKANAAPAKIAVARPLPIKTFKVNLKHWNMTTIEDVRKYLHRNNYPADFFIRINKQNNTITVNAPEPVLEKLEKLFKKLQNEEKELNNLKE